MKSGKFLGFIALCVGFAAIGATGFANWTFGQRVAADLLTPSINLILDVAAFVGFSIVAWLWIQKKYLASAPALIFACGFLLVSALNVVGYMASGRIAVATANQINLENKIAAQNETIKLRRDTMNQLIVSATDKKVWKSRANMLADEVSKVANSGPVDPVKVTSTEAMGDAQAAVFAWFTKADQNSVQIILAAILSVMLVLVKPWASIYGTMLLIGNNRTSKKEKLVETTREEFEKAIEDALGDQVDQWLTKRTVRISTPNLKASEAFKIFQSETGSNMSENKFYRLMRKRLEPDHISRVPAKGMHYHLALYEGPTLVKELEAVAN